MYTLSFFQTVYIPEDNANIKGSGFLPVLFEEQEKSLYMLSTEAFIFDPWLVEYVETKS